MLSTFAGPVFFVIAVCILALGQAFLAMLWRQGWILVGMGMLAMGLAVPGWLTVVGSVACIGAFVTYWYWAKYKFGRSI